MNDDRTLERRIAASFDASAASQEPAGLLDDILLTTSRSRQRPRWLALTKEPPMRISSGVAVGSPTARITALAAATLLLVALTGGAVVAGASFLAGPAALVVAQDGSGTHDTIAAAVAAAEDGDTILVKAGTYVGTVVIDKDITLRGDGPRDEVILAFTADSPSIQTEWAMLPYGILLADTTATVSDLTVRGPNVATAFAIVGGDPTIERVTSTLEGVAGLQPHSGVGLIHGASATIRDSIFDGPIWNLGGARMPAYEEVQGASGLTLSDSIVDNAVWAPMIDGGSITGNTISNGGISIWTLDGGSGEVSGNTVTGISFDGADGSGITVRDNVIRGGNEPDVGIDLGPGSPTIEGNAISDVAVGIAVPNGATPTIRSNAIEGVTTGIKVLGASTAPVIEGNRFCGNVADLVVADTSTLTLDASNEICPAG
jgi:hypothetical protein